MLITASVSTCRPIGSVFFLEIALGAPCQIDLKIEHVSHGDSPMAVNDGSGAYFNMPWMPKMALAPWIVATMRERLWHGYGH